MLHSLVHKKVGKTGKVFLAHVAAEGPLPGVGPLVVLQMSLVIEGPGAVRALVHGAAALDLDVGGRASDRVSGSVSGGVSGQRLVGEETEVTHFAGVRLTVAVQVLYQLLTRGIRYGAQVAAISRMSVVSRCVISKHVPVDEYLAAQRATEPTLINVHTLVLRQLFLAHEGGAAVIAPERQVLRVRDRVLKQNFLRAKVLLALLASLHIAAFV